MVYIFIYVANTRDKKIQSFIGRQWNGSRHLVFWVTRNPNWSQRLGTGTGCVKGRYQHPKYALPKVSYIVYLSDKIQGLVVFPSCWSVPGSRKVLLDKEVLILSGKT